MKEEEMKHKLGVPVIVKDRKSLYKLLEDSSLYYMRGFSKFDLWEISLSIATIVFANSDENRYILSYPYDKKSVTIPKELFIEYDIIREYKRLNGENRCDMFLDWLEYMKVANAKSDEISGKEYRKVCEGNKNHLFFELVANHVFFIIQEFDLEDVEIKRTDDQIERLIIDLDSFFCHTYNSIVYLEKLIVYTIILYARVHGRCKDITFFDETIKQMIERRKVGFYNGYLEESMIYDNFNVLKFRIIDKIKKFEYNRGIYWQEKREILYNDLSDIIFYGLMGLSAVCQYDNKKRKVPEAINNLFKNQIINNTYEENDDF